jgi:predicted nucleic acid-binding Zn ribbon protein
MTTAAVDTVLITGTGEISGTVSVYFKITFGIEASRTPPTVSLTVTLVIMVSKVCYQCRRFYEGRKDAKFCSDRCRLKHWRTLGMGPSKMDVWTAMAEHSYRVCEYCGVKLWRPGFHWPRANKRYCSERCRVAAHRSRQRAREP